MAQVIQQPRAHLLQFSQHSASRTVLRLPTEMVHPHRLLQEGINYCPEFFGVPQRCHHPQTKK